MIWNDISLKTNLRHHSTGILHQANSILLHNSFLFFTNIYTYIYIMTISFWICFQCIFYINKNIKYLTILINISQKYSNFKLIFKLITIISVNLSDAFINFMYLIFNSVNFLMPYSLKYYLYKFMILKNNVYSSYVIKWNSD